MTRWHVPDVPLPPPEIRRKLREANNCTIQAAAQEIGVSDVTYRYWERGLRTPRPDHLRDYEKLLMRWQEAINQD